MSRGILSMPKRPADTPPYAVVRRHHALAEHWRATRNTGAMLIVPESGNASARLGAGSVSATKPTLAVTLVDGTQRVLAVDVAGFAMSSRPRRTQRRPLIAVRRCGYRRQTRGMMHCPALTTSISRSHAAAVVARRRGRQCLVRVHVMQTTRRRCWSVVLAHRRPRPRRGGRQRGCAGIGHPDVFATGDFSRRELEQTPGVWTDESLGRSGQPVHVDEESSSTEDDMRTRSRSPGRYYLDTCTPRGGRRGCSVRSVRARYHRPCAADHRRADVIDEAFLPRRGLDHRPDSFWSISRSSFRPVGMDLRHGVGRRPRLEPKGGSASCIRQQTKVTDAAARSTQSINQWLLQGHSIRGHTLAGHPTSTAYPQAIGTWYRAVSSGPYDTLWDGGLYGTEQNLRLYMTEADGRLRQHCIPKGRWVTMESQTRLNTIDLSAPDAYGKRHRTQRRHLPVWPDGVLVGERTDVAWRCHPHIGVKSNWLMQLHGGNTPTDHDIRLQLP